MRAPPHSLPGLSKADHPALQLRLDAFSAVPLYLQLQSQLQTLLQHPSWDTRRGLPTERALAQALGVSRTVVNRAYDALRQNGLMDTFGRLRTDPSPTPLKIQPEMVQAKSLAQEMQEQGLHTSTEVMELTVQSNRLIASIFARPSDTQFLHTTRVHLGNSMPIAREDLWIDLSLCPAMANWDGHGSTYAQIEQRHGWSVCAADQTIEAVICSAEEQRSFRLDHPIPCLLVKRKTYVGTRQLAEYSAVTFRGDAYTYHLNLQN